MRISIRRFEEKDIPYKIKWINDKNNNKYLHYDLPLREDKTLIWFQSVKNRSDRADYTILYDGEPAGLIGLINIDRHNKKAEYYICLGGEEYKGKGIATAATKLLLSIAYTDFALDYIYLYTETENHQAQKLFERVGFKREGLLKNDLIYNGRKIHRYVYCLNLKNYFDIKKQKVNY